MRASVAWRRLGVPDELCEAWDMYWEGDDADALMIPDGDYRWVMVWDEKEQGFAFTQHSQGMFGDWIQGRIIIERGLDNAYRRVHRILGAFCDPNDLPSSRGADAFDRRWPGSFESNH